jgi:hypothetical protein
MSTNNMKSGAQLIAAERTRQLAVEGWDAAHDDGHRNGEIACAAIAYAFPMHALAFAGSNGKDMQTVVSVGPLTFWPWAAVDFKPANPDGEVRTKEQRIEGQIRNLVKAGALIAAEIDRLQRLATTQPPPPGE